MFSDRFDHCLIIIINNNHYKPQFYYIIFKTIKPPKELSCKTDHHMQTIIKSIVWVKTVMFVLVENRNVSASWKKNKRRRSIKFQRALWRSLYNIWCSFFFRFTQLMICLNWQPNNKHMPTNNSPPGYMEYYESFVVTVVFFFCSNPLLLYEILCQKMTLIMIYALTMRKYPSA